MESLVYAMRVVAAYEEQELFDTSRLSAMAREIEHIEEFDLAGRDEAIIYAAWFDLGHKIDDYNDLLRFATICREVGEVTSFRDDVQWETRSTFAGVRHMFEQFALESVDIEVGDGAHTETHYYRQHSDCAIVSNVYDDGDEPPRFYVTLGESTNWGVEKVDVVHNTFQFESELKACQFALGRELYLQHEHDIDCQVK